MDERFIGQLSHHRLRVWHEAVALVREVREVRISDAGLRDQALRAVQSVALNIAEASGREGNSKKQHMRIARGSVIEVVAAYEVACAMGEKLDARSIIARGARIAAMLTGLVR